MGFPRLEGIRRGVPPPETRGPASVLRSSFPSPPHRPQLLGIGPVPHSGSGWQGLVMQIWLTGPSAALDSLGYLCETTDFLEPAVTGAVTQPCRSHRDGMRSGGWGRRGQPHVSVNTTRGPGAPLWGHTPGFCSRLSNS